MEVSKSVKKAVKTSQMLLIVLIVLAFPSIFFKDVIWEFITGLGFGANIYASIGIYLACAAAVFITAADRMLLKGKHTSAPLIISAAATVGFFVTRIIILVLQGIYINELEMEWSNLFFNDILVQEPPAVYFGADNVISCLLYAAGIITIIASARQKSAAECTRQ